MTFWAGPGYDDSYIITLMFFISLFVPLIQNMGITILQARNEMKFRSLLYIVIAAFSLVGQIVLSKLFGAVGCAVSIAGALVIGQGIVMNIYYQKRQDIDIKGFWLQIIKMSIAPAVITAVSYILLRRIQVSSIFVLLLLMAVFAIVFIAGLWLFSMSEYEKSLIKEPIMKFSHRK